MKEIILKPYGGLANRLFAINAAIQLSQKYSCNLRVIWELNNELGCSYHDIFNPSDRFSVEECTIFKWYKPKSYLTIYNAFHHSHYRFPYFNKMLGRERTSDRIYYNHPVDLVDFRFSFDNSDEVNSIYIAAHNQFFGIKEEIFKFQPVKKIDETVDKICSAFDKKTVGIHIRRRDHKVSIARSTDRSFIDALNKLVKSGFNFYLATDNIDTKQKFVNMFPDLIKFHDIHSYERNSKLGICDAVIDLYCLSKTGAIYGSAGSEFSRLASKLGRLSNYVVC